MDHEFDRRGICLKCGGSSIEFRDSDLPCIGLLQEAELIQILQDESTRLRRREHAARALGRVGGKAAVPALCAILDSKDTHRKEMWDLAQESAISLGRIGGAKACGSLMQAVQHPGAFHNAILALAHLRATEAVDLLVAVLSDPREEFQHRLDSALALGDIGDHRALEPLLVARHDALIQLKSDTRRALAKMFYCADLTDEQKNRLLGLSDLKASIDQYPRDLEWFPDGRLCSWEE